LKKVTFLFVLLFAVHSVGFAAIGGSSAPKTSSPPPLPKSSTSQPSTSPSTSSQQGYSPSAPASSYSEKAPATAAKPSTTAIPQQQQSGGFLRSAGLFGGGMLLGSMLGGMMGFGQNSMLASLINVLFIAMLAGGALMGVRYLWNKFQASRRKDDEIDRRF